MLVIDPGSRRILQPGGLLRLRTLGWMVVLAILAISPAFVRLPILLDAWGLLLYAASALASLAIYALAVRIGEARAPQELSPRFALTELPLGMLTGAAFFAVAIGILALSGWYEIRPARAGAPWLAAGQALRSGVVEEIFARAVILRLLWHAFGLGWAMGISSLLFGGLHLMNPDASLLASMCIALEAGVGLGVVYAITGRVWLPIGLHAGWNFTQGWIFGASVSGGGASWGAPLASAPTRDAPGLITGGAFGVEASAVLLLLAAPPIALLLRQAWRKGLFAVQAQGSRG